MIRKINAFSVILLITIIGCGDGKNEGMISEDKILQASVKEFGELYSHFQNEQKRPAKNANELVRLYGPAYPSGETLPGRPDWMIAWGSNLPAENPTAIFAYSKNHKDGDPVLMGDGKLKNISVAEFESATKLVK